MQCLTLQDAVTCSSALPKAVHILDQEDRCSPSCRNEAAPLACRRNFGEFWLLKLVLSELNRDLRHRLSVYAKGKTAADKQDSLLVNSQLWRMLEVVGQLTYASITNTPAAVGINCTLHSAAEGW